jgi:hypothetical protein
VCDSSWSRFRLGVDFFFFSGLVDCVLSLEVVKLDVEAVVLVLDAVGVGVLFRLVLASTCILVGNRAMSIAASTSM